MGSSDDNTPSKTGKKTPERKVNPKAKESSNDTTPKASKANKDVYTAKGFFFFTEKAKHKFEDNNPIISGGHKKKDKKYSDSIIPEKSTSNEQETLQTPAGMYYENCILQQYVVMNFHINFAFIKQVQTLLRSLVQLPPLWKIGKSYMKNF